MHGRFNPGRVHTVLRLYDFPAVFLRVQNPVLPVLFRPVELFGVVGNAGNVAEFVRRFDDSPLYAQRDD